MSGHLIGKAFGQLLVGLVILAVVWTAGEHLFGWLATILQGG